MNEVQAVKTPAQIDKVETLLAERGQVYADVWRIGINLALRIGDLLSLKFSDVEDDFLELVEQKTGKRRTIKINAVARAVIERRRADNPHHVWLFQSDANRSKRLIKPLSREVVARVFQQVGEGKSVKVKLGTHSMRKTRGWIMYSNGAPIERIAKTLNHSSPAVTMRYIGLEQADIDAGYDEFCI